MKSLTIISGQLYLLHQFKNDFAHLLAFNNLVIELLNAKKWAKKKLNTRYNYRKFAQFYELVKFIIGPKVLVIGPFRCTTYVDSDKNILEPFCTKMHSDAMRLTDQSGYSICLLYGQGFHTYSTSNILFVSCTMV